MNKYILNGIFNIFNWGLAIVIIKMYFSIFFPKKDVRKIEYLFWGLYTLWNIVSSYTTAIPAFMKIIISVSIIFCLTIFTYKGVHMKKLMFSIMIVTMWMLMELLTAYIFISYGIDYRFPRVLGSFLSECITLILVVILKKFFNNKMIKDLPLGYSALLMMISIGSMFVIYNFFMLSSDSQNKSHVELSVIVVIIMLAINFTIYNLYVKLAEELEIRKYNTVYAQQLELYKKYIQEKEELLLDIRKSRHDIKQHYIALSKMLEKQKYQKCVEYLKGLLDSNIFFEDGIAKTDNIVVDALINSKYALAKRKGIDFITELNIPMQLPFESADLSIVLGNILDNALEANSSGGKIFLGMKYEKSILFVFLRNTYNRPIKRDKDGEIVTNKSDASNHGIGLKSVKNITEKYHGASIIEIGEKEFVMKISMLPLEGKNDI